MSDDVVGFGRYRGQSIEALAADRRYCEWLLMQPWFTKHHKKTHRLLMQMGIRVEETPEHNKMQARFLDQDLCEQLARWLVMNSSMERVHHEWFIEFEECNWDLYLTVGASSEEEWNINGQSVTGLIELKPIIGDDYPVILRNIKKRGTRLFDRTFSGLEFIPMVIADEFESDAVTLEQAQVMFQKSGIELFLYSRFLEMLS